MKNKILTAMALWAGLFSSCSKIIDLNSPTALPPEKFYSTESDIKYAVAGVYGLLRTNYSIYYQMGEMPSDNAETHFESEGSAGFWDKLTWTAYTTNFEDIWINFYNTIGQCNLVLSKLEGVTFKSASTKKQYVAELKFIRSLMYFELVHFFGEVPLALDLVTNDKQAFALTRKTLIEVYAQIEKDLTEAEGDVPPLYTTVTDMGRVTSTAVKALLGKVYLYQEKYAEAEKKLSEVVKNPSYGLMLNHPSDVFSITDEYNKEVIFTIQYSRVLAGVGEGSSFAALFLPEGSGLTTVSNNSQNIGTLDPYRLFKAGDKRKDMIGILRRSNTTDSTSYNFYFYTKKFTDNPPSAGDGENNWIVIRYADVLLFYAEALNEQRKTVAALKEVNKVRERAGASELALTLEQTQTRAAIKLERRLELCFEGHRWPDLVRWGDHLTVMNAFKTKYGVTAMLPNDYGKLFPIPNRERIINPALTQNHGY